jgi:hypothetical protein
MMLLKMQIEKARGEAELVQIKAQLNQMRGAAAAAGGCGVMTQQPSCVVSIVVVSSVNNFVSMHCNIHPSQLKDLTDYVCMHKSI